MTSSFRLIAGIFLLSVGFAAAAQELGSSRPNSAPTIAGAPATSVTQGGGYDFTPGAQDANGDKLYFRLANRPAWLNIDAGTGRLTAKTAATKELAAGTVYSNLRLRVSDGRSSTVLPAFSITVKSGATAPAPAPAPTPAPAPALTLGGTPATSSTVGKAYSFRPTVSGASGTLSFSVANKPSWASFDIATGQLSGTPAAGNVGAFANITILASTASSSTKLTPFTINVAAAAGGTPPVTTNAPPSIAGAPGSSVVAGNPFSFQPTASDPEKAALSFAIQNKPVWASFNTSTGALTGTPTAVQVSRYDNIVISASDGATSTSLAAFSILVTATAAGGTTLSWTIPTQNTDGTGLSNLAGYRLYYGNSSTALNQTTQIANPGTTTYVVSNLTSGTWYFAVAAYSSAGQESVRSGVASTAIP